MKYVVTGLMCLLLGMMQGRAEGIVFFKGTFEEARQKAMTENKLIFMDIYTPWCGPCLNMEERVFTTGLVGEYYNRHFINIKIDWESPEGRVLAQRFYVASFPAFLFIDPEKTTIVHEHGGFQDACVFLRLGQAALDSLRCSSQLIQGYAAGDRSRALLLAYANYKAERRDMNGALGLLEEAVSRYQLAMDVPEVTDFFFEYFTMTELEHPLCQYFLAHREQMYERYGKEKVDRKLFTLYRYTQDRKEIEEIPDFQGKKFLLQALDFNTLAAQQQYDEADRILWSMAGDPEVDQADLCELMKFTARGVLKRGGDPVWKKKCLSYFQYVAYNQENRQDPEIHFQYAAMLESVIREHPEIHSYFPESVTRFPEKGKTKYSLNKRALAPKKQKN